MSVWTAMLLAAVMIHQLFALDNSGDEQLRYVVALINGFHFCYGTLISSNWVLTAANCLDATSIQYGNLSISYNESASIRNVLSTEQPPSSKIVEPDLGLLYINAVPQFSFIQLSAVDYRAMTGHVVQYTDFKADQDDILKDGVISSCNSGKKSFTSLVCVAPKCSDKQQLSLPGEPGSPLFYDGKLAGVHVASDPLQNNADNKLYFMRTYTPISPYLAWVSEVVNTKQAALYK